MIFHVAKTGNDSNGGSEKAPFLTIQRAAGRAKSGDVVLVHQGVYREWVKPRFGGKSSLEPIIYEAVRGEKVTIKGSEILDDWVNLKGSLWTARVDNRIFGDDNPYEEVLYGDWFVDQGRHHHRGEVFLNGKALFEKTDYDSMAKADVWEPALDHAASHYTWYSEQDTGSNETVFFCNFQDKNPNEELVEITVRPACFYPHNTGLNYITVKGFELCQAAVPWAPPSAEQMGLIGPHWAKGWVIEECEIWGAKCSGISLGKEQGSGENEWEHYGLKHGSQLQRDAVFKALKLGWSRETVGSHKIMKNHIYDCGQTGICGHLGGVFSEISDNHIHHIHSMDQFTGHEMGGIKIHAALDMLIRGNRIHHCTQGLWMDWQAQGLRITGNLLYENRWNDLHIEVSHGPYVVDNNIFLSPLSLKNISQGGCYAHNLIGGRVLVQNVPNRFTPYHFSHSTDVMGVMTILGGDDRWYNNMFLTMDPGKEPKRQKMIRPDENREMTGADPFGPMVNSYKGFGLSVYDDFPLTPDEWAINHTVNSFARVKLPVKIDYNYYANGVVPFNREESPRVCKAKSEIVLEEKDGKVLLILNLDGTVVEPGVRVTTAMLGSNFETEAPYEDYNGMPLELDGDYFDEFREIPLAGPFANLTPGKQTLVVWED
jgi:alpha-N-arabinofuranosidase